MNIVVLEQQVPARQDLLFSTLNVSVEK